MSVWVTKDGRKIPIKKMTNSHLLNTIRFLDRNFERMREARFLEACLAEDWFNGEMAQLSCEQEQDRLDRATGPDDLDSRYEEMIDEAERRNLEFPDE